MGEGGGKVAGYFGVEGAGGEGEGGDDYFSGPGDLDDEGERG